MTCKCGRGIYHVPDYLEPEFATLFRCRRCCPAPLAGNRGVIKEKRGIEIAPREYKTATAEVYDFG